MAATFNHIHAVFALLLTLCCSIGPAVAATKIQKPGLTYFFDKTPAWIEKVPSPAAKVTVAQDSGSMQILLSDTQVNLLGPKPVTYVHGKHLTQERSGLEGVSTIRISFNPRFETLTVHDLAVFRDGRRIDQRSMARIDLAQRESRLEEGVYDEDVEAIVAFTDVRVGDVVEFGYSIAGENPIFAGRHSSFFVLNRDQPIARLSVRVQYPADRKLNYRLYRSDLPVVETLDRNIRKISLDAEKLPPVRTEEAVPVWFGMYPSLQVTEYAAWEDVGAWARGLYEIPTDLSPEIEAVLDRLKSEAKTKEELVASTLAWVQNEIRYYSIVVGTSSHRPNHPNVTVRQRFGDCKDKSLLLSAMLQRLGIRAEPALVSNRIRKRVAEILPTPLAFDHVIVRAQLDDTTYWLDATRTYQGYSLKTLGFVPFGKALVISRTQEAKFGDVVPPQGARSGTEVVETFKIEKYGTPVVLVMQQKYYGAFAEWLRRQLAANGARRMVESLQADYGRDLPSISITGDPVIADDALVNVVTLTQTFAVPQLFNYEAGRAKTASIYARSIVPWLRFPGSPDRKFPLALPFPDTYEHIAVFELPNKLPLAAPNQEKWQDRHYALNNRIAVDGNRVTFSYSARVLQDHVAPMDFPSFSEKFKQASGMLFSTLYIPLVEPNLLRNRLVRDFEASGINLRKADQLDNFHQKFLRDYAFADESIRSGLLAGTMLAKAYKDRAQAASLLGRKDDALTDVTKAIEMDADDAANVLKAEVQLYMGRYQEALETLRQVTHKANKPNTLMAVGMANFYLGNYDAAIQAFGSAAEVAGPDDLPYSLIWLTLTEKKIGRVSDELMMKHMSRLATAWPADVVTFMQERTVADNLLAAARQDDKESRLRLCEAYFYLGQKALLDGNLSDAKRWFSKSVETRAFMYREHTFAQHELARLERR